jgi:hypothetical protein
MKSTTNLKSNAKSKPMKPRTAVPNRSQH